MWSAYFQRRAERGSATITALIVVGVAAVLLAGLMWRQQIQIRSLENNRDRIQAQWLQRAAIDFARLVLVEDQRANQYDHLEGLLKLPNYSASILEQLRPFVVILPNVTTINANTASPEVLMAAVSGLSRGAANSFVQQRAVTPFKSIDEITGLLNKIGGAQGVAIDPGLIDVKSQFWLANTEIRLGRGIFVSSALIQRSPTALPGGNYTQVIWSRTGKIAAD